MPATKILAGMARSYTHAVFITNWEQSSGYTSTLNPNWSEKCSLD
jgi:hypothetical protein